jgi:hypothetical protein
MNKYTTVFMVLIIVTLIIGAVALNIQRLQPQPPPDFSIVFTFSRRVAPMYSLWTVEISLKNNVTLRDVSVSGLWIPEANQPSALRGRLIRQFLVWDGYPFTVEVATFPHPDGIENENPHVDIKWDGGNQRFYRFEE